MARKKTEARADDVEDVEDKTPAGMSFKVPEFSNARAQEIAAHGYRIAHEIDVLIRKEERHVKIVTKLREDRKARNRDLIRLYADERAGQTTLNLDKPAEGGAEPSPGSDAPKQWAKHGGKTLAVVEIAPESWASMIDGRTVGEGCFSASDAKEVFCGELGMSAEDLAGIAWTEGEPSQPPLPAGPTFHASVDGLKQDGVPVSCVVLRVGKTWMAAIDGKDAGEFPSKAKATRAVVALLEANYPDTEVPPLKWVETVPEIDEPMNVEYGAKVGRKACVLRQAEPGKWMGRIGGLPVANELPLEVAKAACEAELRKGKPDAEITWQRTET